LILALAKPMGAFMTKVFAGERTFLHPVLRPVERLCYVLCGVKENTDQRWTQYAGSMLAFSVFSFLILYLLQRMQGILPLLGGLIMYFFGGWSLWLDWDVATQNSYTMWTVPGLGWQIGGTFVIAFVAALVGLIVGIYMRFAYPAYFRKQTLTRSTPTLVPDE